MRILIAGGTGFIGRHLIDFWSNHKITVVGRNKEKINQLFKNKIDAYEWTNLDCLNPKHFDAVINLSGESINHFRWTQRVKNDIITSRVDSTKKLVNWCIRDTNKKIKLLSASGLSIYGLQSTLPSEYFTEQSEPHYTGFMAEVAKAWEAEAILAQNQHIQTSIMRFAMVLDAKEGALPKILLPYRFYLGGQIGSGKQPVSWISIYDLVRAIDFVLTNNLTGITNIVSPITLSQEYFSKTIAKVLKKPCFMKLPANFCKLIFGQMGDELLLHGQYAYPERLLNNNFSFSHANIEKALLDLGIS